jgi:hypothetical protein
MHTQRDSVDYDTTTIVYFGCGDDDYLLIRARIVGDVSGPTDSLSVHRVEIELAPHKQPSTANHHPARAPAHATQAC